MSLFEIFNTSIFYFLNTFNQYLFRIRAQQQPKHATERLSLAIRAQLWWQAEVAHPDPTAWGAPLYLCAGITPGTPGAYKY